MLPSKANWLFREKQDLSPAVQDESMQLSSIVLQLLQQRNITTVEDIQHFMSPLLSDLYEPINLRSEEHTSELQSRGHLVCRLLLEKKKYIKYRLIVRNQKLCNDSYLTD